MHERGRAVLLLGFKSGARLVYKPRSVMIAESFQGLLDWINVRQPPRDFKTITVVPREGYGWIEFVEHDSCADQDAVHRFFERQGAMIALLHSIAAIDVHYENLIAAGEVPVLVDHETLFYPEYAPDRDAPAKDAAQQVFFAGLSRDSLRRIGILPYQRLSRVERRALI